MPRLPARRRPAPAGSDSPSAGEAPSGPQAAPDVPPSRFAVPETPEERRAGLAGPVVVPERTDEDEEILIAPPKRQQTPPARGLIDRYEKRFVFLLFLLGSLAVLITSNDLGMAWDEAYYVDAARRTRDWVVACFLPGEVPIGGEAIDRYWDAAQVEPRGHPSVARFLAALGLATAPGGGDVLPAMRRPFAFCFGLTLLALYLLVRRTHGRVSAWLTVLAYFTMPRVFAHAHFALTETPMTLLSVAVVYAFLRGLESGRWAVATGVLFGLAMATKINALALPAILLPWAFVFHRREAVNNLFAMLLVSPLAMVLAWPWLWHNSLEHFAQYLLWNFGHRQIGVLYFHKIYPAAGSVPWHYPFVFLLTTVPVLTLVLAAFGIARTVRATRRHYLGLLYLWAAAVPCLMLAMPGTPKYDGERLLLNAFPFLAALAGIGGSVLVRIGAFFDRPGGRISRGQCALAVVALALTINGAAALCCARPFYLTYFNSLIGGRRGAAERGLEVTYWGEALNRRVLGALNTLVPDGASLMPRALNIEVLRHAQRSGLLKASIHLVEDRGPVDFQLLHHRPGMYGRSDAILHRDYRGREVAVFGPEESPLLTLYRTGTDFEKHWRSQAGP